MSFLLDTNVISEWVKPRPNLGVLEWLAKVDEGRLYISVITVAEIRYGIDRLAQGRRRQRLNIWLQKELPRRFDKRLLSVNEAVATAWGSVVAAREAGGRPMGVMDAFLAATCEVHELALVTRDRADFHGIAAEVIDPWVATS